MMTTMYAIRKIPSQAREPIVIDVDDIEEFTWIEPLQKAIEERLNEPDFKTIWLTSTTVRNNGLLGLALCFKQVFIIAQNDLTCGSTKIDRNWIILKVY